MMSALEISYSPNQTKAAPRIHIVRDGETSAHFRRKVHQRGVARTTTYAIVRTYAGLGSITAVFMTAVVTLVAAFMSIPNTPIP